MPTKIRINLANEQELRELPGIGAPEAATIVRFRAEHGPITDAAALARVLGTRPLLPRHGILLRREEDVMRAVICHAWGAVESLKVEEVPAPVPAADEVLIDVRATSVNYADSIM